MTNVDDAIREVRRELMVRAIVYPRLVQQGKLSHEEADRRMAMMVAAQQYLEVFRAGQVRTPATGGNGHQPAPQRHD